MAVLNNEDGDDQHYKMVVDGNQICKNSNGEP